ncbi:hypothetical protein DUNSADRAFT_13055 [Dunaliella salina]|uniref:Uncharacterized protein n=1 Tax=Dunaliella salina TaxID=3046 RepID=A0ABQ7H3F2_DUNSA|nr:hypothetical protein DUNSADRAFT_13055 [Dunaliella salina]|eukprot:KAF5841392.1 hypothetical protein DUNSADRAFT_13055 [Dunaliella salina]
MEFLVANCCLAVHCVALSSAFRLPDPHTVYVVREGDCHQAWLQLALGCAPFKILATSGVREILLWPRCTQIATKPGYSWRVGVHPPVDKPLDQLSPMEVLVMQRSTKAAIMMLELKEAAEEGQLPEIKLHLYKADMLNCIIEMDQYGFITRPALSPLDPTGYMFGCHPRSMQRRPIRNYLKLPGKGPDSLLQNDKVKGAMKKGTGTGHKVGPLKVLAGFHADGSPLSLNVLLPLKSKHLAVQAREVGPLKVLAGFHADGSPTSLNVLKSFTKGAVGTVSGDIATTDSKSQAKMA